MKNLLLALVTISVLFSCSEVSVAPAKTSVAAPRDVEVTLDYSNPSVFMGTDFGNFFKMLYRQGRFEDMLLFTSSQSVEKFGRDAILDFYEKDFKFGYELGRLRSETIDGDVITLNYNANIIATKRVIRISVVVENDSCKIVLPNKLKDFPG